MLHKLHLYQKTDAGKDLGSKRMLRSSTQMCFGGLTLSQLKLTSSWTLETVEAPSLKIFKVRLDKALNNII